MLIQGDSRNINQSITSAALVLTDPPYGINYQNPYTHNKQDVLKGDCEPFSYNELAKISYKILRQNSALFLFTGWGTYAQHYLQVEAAGFKMREPLITDPGDLVVNLCAGSGTALLAAKQLNRRFLGYEIDPKYAELANWRLDHNV